MRNVSANVKRYLLFEEYFLWIISLILLIVMGGGDEDKHFAK